MVIFCYYQSMNFLSMYQTAYITSAVVAAGIVVFLLILLVYRNFYESKHLRELTYLKLYRLSNRNDFLLLNAYRINIDDKHVAFIDHILISKKFIILINDFAISGVISGDFQSDELANTKKNGTDIIANPLNFNINLTKRLALFTGLNQSFLKGLVVINNDSDIRVDNMNKQFQIIKRKDLAKTIRAFDKEDVKNLNEDSVVKFINFLNEHNS